MSRDRRTLMREVDKKASTCGWPECTKQVPLAYYLCSEHWRMIPSETRSAWQTKYRGAANSKLAATKIDEAIAMFKNTSQNSQSRTRRQAEHSTYNSGGIAKDAFKDMTIDSLELRLNVVNGQLHETETKLARVKVILDEAALRRGTFHSRSVPVQTELRWVQEKRMLLSEINALRLELNKIKTSLSLKRSTAKENSQDFNSVFHAMAKEMLAGPVYDRIVTATIHRVSEAAESTKT